ncbi:MAG TPA: hypothetical protein VI248_13500 [Kineosporiaceae bacterium]
MSEFFTVTSLMAIVPDSELSSPILTESPDTAMAAAGADEDELLDEPTLLPQAASVTTAARHAEYTAVRRPQTMDIEPSSFLAG